MSQTQTTGYEGGAFGMGAFGADEFGGHESFDLPQASRSDKSRQSTQWETCSRCGFTYPIAEIRLQAGDGGNVKVCTVSCWDEPSIQDLRPDELPKEKPLIFVDEGGMNN